MKKLTIHEMAERYKIMSGIGGTINCLHCNKSFDFSLTDFEGLHLTAGLYYRCPHCKHILSLEICVVDGIKEKTLRKES